MLRIGVIGAGKWGANHLRILSEAPCKLVGIADTDEQNGLLLAGKYGIQFKRDFVELIPMVDAVTVATPASTHFEIAAACILEGKHAFVEKPLSLTMSHAQELVILANQRNTVLVVGHLYRLNPAVIRLKEELKTIGLVQSARLRYMNLNMEPPPDCGIIFDYGSHLIDLAVFLLERNPEKLICIEPDVLSIERGKSASILLDYGDFTATLELSWLHPRQKRRDAWFVGQKGSIYADLLTQNITTRGWEKIPPGKASITNQNIQIEQKEPLKEELWHFIDCIEKGVKPVNSGEEACRVVRLCELALESNQIGCEVRV